MTSEQRCCCAGGGGDLSTRSDRSGLCAAAESTYLPLVLSICAMLQLAGCVSDKVDEQGVLTPYQRRLADQGPQQRLDTAGQDSEQPLGLLRPIRSQSQVVPDVEIATDPNTGEKIVALTIEQAIARTLANSPEIQVVSFDPSIAQQDVTKAASQFDVTAFGEVNYEQEDNPPNSIFQPGLSDVRTLESGLKQKGITGSEWSLSYALTRAWDDLIGRTLSTRYEPILGFQLRQPLLRDAGQEVTLAGVNIARLNYRIALLAFREKAEDIATQVISAYWRLLETRQNREISAALVRQTYDTLKKVQGRRDIDATDVQIKQAEAFAKAREAALIQAKKAVIDAQDTLMRLMADSQLNILDEFTVVPVSDVSLEAEELQVSEILKVAMRQNPAILQAKIATEIADVNIRAAENQDLPRLDLIASARTQGLDKSAHSAQDRLNSGDFISYAVGLSLEYQIGNRQREAELLQRRLQRRKATATLQNTADQVAVLAKEGVRKVETNYVVIQVQKDAVQAVRIHLQALEDSEAVRAQLTPEFLMVKLQAQEILANARQSEIGAIVEFNVSLAEVARILGTVFELRQVSTSLAAVSAGSGPSE